MKQWITFAPADIKKPQTYANAGSIEKPAARLKLKFTVLRAVWGCGRGEIGSGLQPIGGGNKVCCLVILREENSKM